MHNDKNFDDEILNHQINCIKFFANYKTTENTKILQIFHVAGAANIAFFTWQFPHFLTSIEISSPFLAISPFIFSFSSLVFAYWFFYITDSANYYSAGTELNLLFYRSKKNQIPNFEEVYEKQKKYYDSFTLVAEQGQLWCLFLAIITYFSFLVGVALLVFNKSKGFLCNSPCFEISVLTVWSIFMIYFLYKALTLFGKISNSHMLEQY